MIIQTQIQESRIDILAIGINNYEHLQRLSSAFINLDKIKHIFTENESISIYQDNQIRIFPDISSTDFRNIIVEFTHSRSATGDILIFYFFGHGAVLKNGEFYFCTKDTINGIKDSLLPLSAISFREVVNTLSSVDVIPCFIIDSCFSGTSINTTNINIGLNLEYQLNQSLGNSYAILASSGSDSYSYERTQGSIFTSALVEIMENGLHNHRNHEFISISNISKYVNEKLIREGAPLIRLDIGKTFPNLHLCRNRLFSNKIRRERFVPSYKPLFEFMWNNGNPRGFTPDEIRQDMPSAYGNNRKFMYIWGLLKEEFIQDNGKKRVLSQKGIEFCQNRIPIYDEMILIEDTNLWQPSEVAKLVYFKDI